MNTNFNNLYKIIIQQNFSSINDIAQFLYFNMYNKNIIKQLYQSQIKMLELRYGLKNGKIKTLEEISKFFNISKVRARYNTQQLVLRIKYLVQRQHLYNLKNKNTNNVKKYNNNFGNLFDILDKDQQSQLNNIF